MFIIDKYSRIPIYEQLVEQVEHFVMSKILTADSILPSVRSLSQELSINPNTIQKAYSELERRGICYSVPGNGRFISKDALTIITGQKKSNINEIAQLSHELKQAGYPLDDVLKAVIAAYAESGKDQL